MIPPGINRLSPPQYPPLKTGVKSGSSDLQSTSPNPSLPSTSQPSASTGESFTPTGTAPSGDKELWSVAQGSFAAWDKDGNGHLTDIEIEGALKNPHLTHSEKATLETLRGRQSKLQKYSNDEWFRERSGTTVKDLITFQNAGDGEALRLEEQYSVERALIDEPQAIKDHALANRNTPAILEEKIGTRDYYLERYKDFRRRNPSEKAPDYYLNYGLKYFDRFHAQKGALQETARQWVDRTGVALQKAMEARNSNPQSFAELERDSDKFKTFAYASHPEAYISSGLQHTSFIDRIKVGMTPDPDDLLTKDGLKQAIETGAIVLGQDLRNLAIATGSFLMGKSTAQNQPQT